MNITLLDTKTGDTKEIEDTYSESWWAEGNGSCDCNRAIFFEGTYEELSNKHKKDNPELYDKKKPWQTYCIGCQRILIIKIDSKEYSLEEFNEGYPEELIKKHLTSGCRPTTNPERG